MTMTAFLRLLIVLPLAVFLLSGCDRDVSTERQIIDFGDNWRFHLGDLEQGQAPELDDSQWRQLSLPHDWSIEGAFSEAHLTGPQGGSLPAGIGWYRKTFSLPKAWSDRRIAIDFDGIYRNSEVWINGTYLGKRPNGYISFRYDLSEYLHTDEQENVLAVRVDNAEQPNSRWYTGSGIYRNVWLVATGQVHVDHWGTFVTTPEVSQESAHVNLAVRIKNLTAERIVQINTTLYNARGQAVAEQSQEARVDADAALDINQQFTLSKPSLWSLENPHLYRASTVISAGKQVLDTYETEFGIRSFRFDRDKGFFLNDKPVKITGVNMHHDLGALGAAVNTRAIERQLEILRAMGVNAIRTGHTPPAPEFLQLTDRMGFLVMNEAFDSWKLMKTEYARYDYHRDWDEWHERDLRDFIKRDRNHPSVILWSIGNEVAEQFHEDPALGIRITQELAAIVRSLDNTRVITSGNNNPHPDNPVFQANALDVLGFNYYIGYHPELLERFPEAQGFIATETTAPLAIRGHYDLPADVHHIWPPRDDYAGPEPDNDNQTASDYDNAYAAFGSAHQDAWRIIRDHDFMAGMFIWSGFDYLGEPTPYGPPARSSYFGVIDLAGFPKDAYYLYQSEWTNEPVLHVLPHWNWSEYLSERDMDTVDVWAYSNFPEVELYLNGESLGIQRKTGQTFHDANWHRVRRGHTMEPDRDIENLHFSWPVTYQPGTLRAVARDAQGNDRLVQEVTTADAPYKLELVVDRNQINADGKDLAFVTVCIVDSKGVRVPHASNRITFNVEGAGYLRAVDNGDPRGWDSFQADNRRALHGKALAIVQSTGEEGSITLRATAEGLQPANVTISAY